MRAALLALVLLSADGGVLTWNDGCNTCTGEPGGSVSCTTVHCTAADGGVRLPGPGDGFTHPGGPADAGAHSHCWHPSPIAHAAPNHRDEFCCHCPAERCLRDEPPEHCRGHGPRCAWPQINLSRPRGNPRP